LKVNRKDITMSNKKNQILPRGIFRPAYQRYLTKWGTTHTPPLTYKQFEQNKIAVINEGFFTTLGQCSLCGNELSLDCEEPFAGRYKSDELVCAYQYLCKVRLQKQQ
jgi:hypothetical protein